ncbi:hypothetical protein F5B17DRAFT_62481 [Nemania serpens]|nr:hypothetical protein F5B17DRAFT_62481 [Nemania serpens]
MSDSWREKAGALREKAGGLREKAGSWRDEPGGWRNVVEKGGSSLKNQVKKQVQSQVKGFAGRGDTASEPETHVVTPRTALRDPSSFGPPPKHVATYGPRPAAAQASSQAVVPVAGQITQHGEEEEPPAEPRPYRSDTTGLSTSHLPPPPSRYNSADGRTVQSSPAYSPVSTHTPSPTPWAGPTAKPKGPPSLPPRLPPRSGNSTPSPMLASGLPVSQGHLNQGSIDRLGAAGISVPEFGIGGRRAPPPPPGTRPSSSSVAGSPLAGSPTRPPGYGQVDELQARFARMGSPPSPQVGGSRTPAEGTQPPPLRQSPSVLGKKKPPPPPKKPTLSGTRENADAPPPIPLATRPRFD